MQRGPPRPLPELAAGDAHDLDAGLLQPVVGLGVALVGDDQPGREREGVVAVVPLLALGGDRVEPGVDGAQRSMPIAAAAASRKGRGSPAPARRPPRA
jgi:hypothetical protein